MLRKISIGLLPFLFTSVSHAGLYLGASLGPEGASFSQRAHVIGLGMGRFNVIATNHLSGVGGFGSLFAGYGSRFRAHYYLAAEINANYSSVQYNLVNNEHINQNFATTFFTLRTSQGVGLLPGFFLSDTTLFYGRVGYANGRVNIVQGADPSIRSIAGNLSGVRYGLGLRHAFAERWTLMMDYSQINYQSVKSTTFDPFGMVLKYTKIRPNTAQVGFGLIYSFDS